MPACFWGMSISRSSCAIPVATRHAPPTSPGPVPPCRDTAALLLELDPAGTDYLPLEDDHEDGLQANWDVLRMNFEDAPQKLTRGDVLDEWPADFDKPSLTSPCGNGWIGPSSAA